LAHLAIVLVFVVTALGYAPFVEHATDATTVASDTRRTVASADRACDAHPPAETLADPIHSQDTPAKTTDASPTGPRKCALAEAKAGR
jgi:hypothetical protein